jgi:hypothetical protein
MKLICSYIKCYYIGNTFSLVVLFWAGYPTYSRKVTTEKKDLKGLRGSQTSEGVSDQEEARFRDTLQDA